MEISDTANLDEEFPRAVAQFVGAFQLVFGEDWDYSRAHLRTNTDRFIAPGGTFLEPGVDPDRVNWGARAALLRAHEHLLSVMAARGIQPDPPTRDDGYVYYWSEAAASDEE